METDEIFEMECVDPVQFTHGYALRIARDHDQTLSDYYQENNCGLHTTVDAARFLRWLGY